MAASYSVGLDWLRHPRPVREPGRNVGRLQLLGICNPDKEAAEIDAPSVAPRTVRQRDTIFQELEGLLVLASPGTGSNL